MKKLNILSHGIKSRNLKKGAIIAPFYVKQDFLLLL